MPKIYLVLGSMLLCLAQLLTGFSSKAQLKADFTLSADSGCTPFLVNFYDSTKGGTPPYTYVWKFGNGNTGAMAHDSATYNIQGTYQIKLYVTDSKGKTDSASKTIKVKGSPAADYSAKAEHCDIAYYQASANLSTPTPIKSYLWVGEGTPGHGPLYKTGQTAAYQFLSGGEYYFSLVVTGANGCKSAYSDSVKIPPYPGIILPYDTMVCANSTITLTAIPVSGTKPYTFWWGHKSANNFGATYRPWITKDTAFAVHLKDSNSCYSTDSIYIRTMPAPTGQWTYKSIGNETYFHVSDSTDWSISYQWLFGDGDSASGYHANHIYNKYISYIASMIVSDQNGCSTKYDTLISLKNTVEYNLNIYPNPFNASESVQYTLTQKRNVSVILYGTDGRVIEIKKNGTQAPGLYTVEISSEKYSLASGVYILKFITDNSVIYREIVKQ